MIEGTEAGMDSEPEKRPASDEVISINSQRPMASTPTSLPPPKSKDK